MLFSPSNRKYQPYPLSYFSVVVCLRCLLHYILSLIAYTFRKKTGFCFHYYCAVYDECKYLDTFWLADRVRLYITPSHYHHCANLSEDIDLIKCLSAIFVECVSKIKHIFSVIQYTIYGAVCFQFTHFPCDDWDNIHFVLLSSPNRKYELLSIVQG